MSTVRVKKSKSVKSLRSFDFYFLICLARIYGKIIVSEVFLNPKYKTVKPVKDIGGQAGLILIFIS